MKKDNLVSDNTLSFEELETIVIELRSLLENDVTYIHEYLKLHCLYILKCLWNNLYDHIHDILDNNE